MHITQLHARDMEVSLLKAKLKRAEDVCRAILFNIGYIEEIKEYIALEELTGAEELWNELEYPVQKLLITAPRFGGPFTTEERAIIRGFWKITEKDLNNKAT